MQNANFSKTTPILHKANGTDFKYTNEPNVSSIIMIKNVNEIDSARKS